MRREGRDSERRAVLTWRNALSLDRALIYVLAFALFAVPLFVHPAITDYNLGKTIALLILVSLLSGLWGAKILLERTQSVRIPWIATSFVLFALATLLSLLHAVNAREAIQGLLVGFFFLLLFLIVVNEVQEKKDVRLMLSSLLLAGVAAGAYLLLQEARGVAGARGTTMFSTFGNRNYLGGYLAYVIFPAATLILGRDRRLARALSIAAILFTTAIVVFLNQMGTLIALTGAGGISLLIVLVGSRLGVTFPKRHVALIAAVAAVSVAVIGVRLWPMVEPVSSPAAPVTSDDTSANPLPAESSNQASPGGSLGRLGTTLTSAMGENMLGRLLFWSVGLRMLASHPLTGVGLGNYKIVYVPYEVEVRKSIGDGRFDEIHARTEAAHNDYVQVAAELGSIGIVTVVFFLAAFVTSLWVRLRENSQLMGFENTEIMLLAAGLFTLLVHALLSFPASLPASLLVAVMMLGLVLSPAYGERATWRVSLGRRSARAAALVLILLATGGIVFAIREVSGHLLFECGLYQLQVGDSVTAAETLSKSIRLAFSPRYATYYLATAEARAGEYQAALSHFEQSLKQVPDDHVYLLYADLASQLGEIEAARQAISTLLDTNPSESIESRARFIEAQIERLAGNADLALDLLAQLLEFDPSQERAYIGRGDILSDQGDIDGARAAYESALALIDDKLQSVQADLTENPELLVAQYGEKTSELAFLQSEQNRVREALHQLTNAPSP